MRNPVRGQHSGFRVPLRGPGMTPLCRGDVRQDRGGATELCLAEGAPRNTTTAPSDYPDILHGRRDSG